MKMTSSEKIAEALFEALLECPDPELDALTAAVDEFKSKFTRSWVHVRQQPFCRNLLDAIDEVRQFRDEMADPMRDVVRQHRGVAPDTK
jgi:hypothetical protein